MTKIKYLCLSALAVALCVGCFNEGAGPSDNTQSPEIDQTTVDFKYTEISWDDLMPEGEDEILEALYMEFYEEFEQRMMQDSSTLAAAAKNDAAPDVTDISAMITEGSEADTMEQIGTFNVVDALNGKRIRVPGYVVPFDFSATAEHKEFLLVPYFGACLHTPPPPPNQIIFVKADPAAEILDIYEPVWLEGILSTGEFTSDLGNSAYELTLSKLEVYEY